MVCPVCIGAVAAGASMPTLATAAAALTTAAGMAKKKKKNRNRKANARVSKPKRSSQSKR